MNKYYPQNKKFNYTWVNVALCFVMVLTCLGLCSSGKSLYLTAITEALDIKRSAFSINDSCRYIATAVINIFFGSLLLRFGQKKLISAGFICLILSSLIYASATNIFVFYIGGILLGIGLSWTTTTMVSSIIYKWCHKNQGTIMGAILASNGLGAALFAPIISSIIYEKGNPFGYQNAYRLIALVLTIVGLLVVIFLKEKPKEPMKSQEHTSKKETQNSSWEGLSYASAIRKPYFWGAAVCIFLTGMILQGITCIAIPHFTDVGMDPEFVAAVMSVSFLILAASKFLTGYVYDRYGLRITMNICLVASVATMLILTLVTNTLSGKILAIVYTLFSSIALPLETIMLPLYASSLFGQQSFDKILGIFVSVNTAGYALGAPLVNWCFDAFGSYRPSFIISGIIMIFVTVALQFVFVSADRVKKVSPLSSNNAC